MVKTKGEQLPFKDVVKVLKGLLKNSSVSGKDKSKFFIIDKEEEYSLKVVIDLLNDLV